MQLDLMMSVKEGFAVVIASICFLCFQRWPTFQKSCDVVLNVISLLVVCPVFDIDFACPCWFLQAISLRFEFLMVLCCNRIVIDFFSDSCTGYE